MKKIEPDFTVLTLGTCKVKSPIHLSKRTGDFKANFVDDNQRILFDIDTTLDAPETKKLDKKHLVERAGPRERIYFDPAKVHAAIVTCGGLCPGINDVIRSIVMCLWHRYGVQRISGIQYGYRGFLSEFHLPALDLKPDMVTNIHRQGGSILGSSRGHGEEIGEIVDTLERMNINMLFTIGGDGTQRGAMKIFDALAGRDHKIALVGIPKTIDNDLSFVQRSFGFETAVSKALDAVAGAHVEARGAPNGIGIVKVMGRQSGFIAAHTALAINDVNYVLIPEVPFELGGKNGLLGHLEKRILDRGHAVILVAEGAGQDLLPDSETIDASGNKALGDVGIYLKKEIARYFASKCIEINMKYIDPSYIIRSSPANPNDSIYCVRLGTNAVHAAMAGKSGILIGLLHEHFVHIPIRLAISATNCVDPDDELWRDVIEATGQPLTLTNPPRSNEES